MRVLAINREPRRSMIISDLQKGYSSTYIAATHHIGYKEIQRIRKDFPKTNCPCGLPPSHFGSCYFRSSLVWNRRPYRRKHPPLCGQRGRPSFYPPELVQKAIILLRNGEKHKDIALEVGMSRSLISRIAGRNGLRRNSTAQKTEPLLQSCP